MINKRRLVDRFVELVQIDSVSREEKLVCQKLQNIYTDLGAVTSVDGAGIKAGSNTGNLICKFKGTVDLPPLLLSAHMDTVEPGRGVVPVERNGEIVSSGRTILGADDKSAIAVITEVISSIIENNMPMCPIEVVFTICEEVGLLGAKYLDYDQVDSKQGYILDAGDTDKIINMAPGSNKLEFNIYGKAAHAGSSPEKGINAISIASKAIASLVLGRIDEETTCNIGVIEGGSATNVIPSLVNVKGEIRSHQPEKLDQVTNRMIEIFTKTVDDYKKDDTENLPKLEVCRSADYSATCLSADHPVITAAQQAATNIGMELGLKKTGGGSDANIFFNKGIVAGVLGTGMRDVHSVNEAISIDDMVKSAELLNEIIKLYSRNNRD